MATLAAPVKLNSGFSRSPEPTSSRMSPPSTTTSGPKKNLRLAEQSEDGESQPRAAIRVMVQSAGTVLPMGVLAVAPEIR
ncbi:hypothetical protein D3C81_2048420 [compost metagenome]